MTTMSQMECVQLLPKGSFTLPATEFVDWYVGGVLKTGPQTVSAGGDVTVEARINTPGVVFTDGTTSNFTTHKFVAPLTCDLPEHALLEPTASKTDGSCTANPTFTLSNTTSEHGGVQWKIGDPQTNIAPGTHNATWGSTVEVEATLVDTENNDGFPPGQQD